MIAANVVMKRTLKKLSVPRQTLRLLTFEELRVRGGDAADSTWCSSALENKCLDNPKINNAG
jgi:hypothetical protein